MGTFDFDLYILSGEVTAGLTIGLTLLVFGLGYLAQWLFKSQNKGEVRITARQMAFLFQDRFKVEITFANSTKHPQIFDGLALCCLPDGEDKMVKIADLTIEPISSCDNMNFITKREKGNFRFEIASMQIVSAVVDFPLAEGAKQLQNATVYLISRDQRGKAIRAEVNLNSHDNQDLKFKKYDSSKMAISK